MSTYAATFDDSSGETRLEGSITFPDGLGAINSPDVTLLGFYGTDPITKPLVSDPSAAAIITALSQLGLITDDT